MESDGGVAFGFPHPIQSSTCAQDVDFLNAHPTITDEYLGPNFLLHRQALDVSNTRGATEEIKRDVFDSSFGTEGNRLGSPSGPLHRFEAGETGSTPFDPANPDGPQYVEYPISTCSQNGVPGAFSELIDPLPAGCPQVIHLVRIWIAADAFKALDSSVVYGRKADGGLAQCTAMLPVTAPYLALGYPPGSIIGREDEQGRARPILIDCNGIEVVAIRVARENSLGHNGKRCPAAIMSPCCCLIAFILHTNTVEPADVSDSSCAPQHLPLSPSILNSILRSFDPLIL